MIYFTQYWLCVSYILSSSVNMNKQAVRNIFLLLIILFIGSSAIAQYNPLWIRHCRAIPKAKADYTELVPIIEDKIAKSYDPELKFLLGICQFGSGAVDVAMDSFDEVMNDPNAKADVSNDAENFKDYLKNRGFTDQIEVAVGYINIRKGADEDAPLKGRIYKGDRFTILAEEGSWLYVINIQNQGWVLATKNNAELMKKL